MTFARRRPSRRDLLAGAAALAACGPAAVAAAGDLRARIARGGVVVLPPGETATTGLALPDGARLLAPKGGATLRLLGPGPLLRAAQDARRVALEGVTLTGDGAATLAAFERLDELTVTGCAFLGAGAGLEARGCGGSVRDSRFTGHSRHGVFSLDGVAMAIAGNRVEDCGENGVLVWRSAIGDDGARVSGNAIARIRADRPGDGPYGNAIS
ncbi:MAG: hypothetical protein KGI57_09260, partial [Hyphomicrobiales bacterium]|nr:hypothetical protein [Hyphomicrobiales bacterium]